MAAALLSFALTLALLAAPAPATAFVGSPLPSALPTASAQTLAPGRLSMSRGNRGAGAAMIGLRMGQGKEKDESLESLAARLQGGLNSWSGPIEDKIPDKQKDRIEFDNKLYPTPPEGGKNYNKGGSKAKGGGGVAPAKPVKGIRVSSTRQGKGGKTVTEIVGLKVEQEQLKEVLKKIKNKLSVGGRVAGAGDVLEVQGDQVDLVVDLLQREGFKDVKRSGGSSKKNGK